MPGWAWFLLGMVAGGVSALVGVVLALNDAEA